MSNLSDFPELEFEAFDARTLISISTLPFANSNNGENRLPITIFTIPRNIARPRQPLFVDPDSQHVETREQQMERRIDDYHLATSSILQAYHNLRDHRNDEKTEYHHGEESIVDAFFNLVESFSEPNKTEEKSIQYLKIEKYDGETCTCSLCLDEITKDSEIYKLPCNHIFHASNCISEKNITTWVKERGTCPYCRATTDLPETINADGLDPNEILTVMDQASVSREDAIRALRKHHNIVDAILEFDS